MRSIPLREIFFSINLLQIKFKPITIQENETQNVNEHLLQFYSTKLISIPK